MRHRESSAAAQALELLRLAELVVASEMAEGKIARVTDPGNADVLWRARFIRPDVLSMRTFDQALQFLLSFTQGFFEAVGARSAIAMVG